LRPGGLLLSALQDIALAYLRRDVAEIVPFWRLATVPADELAARARAIAAGTGGEAVATEALAGAGSTPGATIPSWGVALPGDHLAALRTNDPPIIARATEGRTILDLRAVEPADDLVLIAAVDALTEGAAEA
jgi:L-seryl-tRNA(Ser) seleniumtransferase